MKKLYVLFILTSCFSFAQDLNLQNGSFSRCAPDKFYDSGGAVGSYADDENTIMTICAVNAGESIILDFLTFSTELNVDILTIYDGADTSAPVIGTYSGTDSPGKINTSRTNESGCLTIQYVSNSTGNTSGWEADITCTIPCQTIIPSIDTTVPEINTSGSVQANIGEIITFNGSAIFSDDGTGANYEWNFGDTNSSMGANVSNTYTAAGSYTVTLNVSDSNPEGCARTTSITVFIVDENIIVDQTTYTVEELVEDILINSDCAQISNIKFSTGTNFGDENGIGYFINDGTLFPFKDGLLLTSGNAANVEGPNGGIGSLSSGGLNWPGDIDLNNEVLINSNNASLIEFDFVPLANRISFDFLMASEEYDMGSFECSFSDAFAFLLTDSDGNVTNLAVLPNTQTPILVTNIHPFNGFCPAIKEEYFGGYISGNTPPMSFDGRTTVFTAQSPVIPGDTYRIKLVIADAGDTALDSGVFLKAGSFKLGGDLGDDRTIVAGNAGCGGNVITLDTSAPSATHTWFKDGIEIEGQSGSTIDVIEDGTYSVNIEFALGCESFSEIIIEFKPELIASVAPNIKICSTLDTGNEFTLSNNDNDILGDLDPADYIISYHLREQDAIDNINPQTIPYINISNPQTIYARLAGFDQECFDTSSFDLEVQNPLPVFNLEDHYILCRDLNGTEVINPLLILDTGFSTPSYSFEWLLNGALIAGAIEGRYIPTEGGTYTVNVTDVAIPANTICPSTDTTVVIESAPPIVVAAVITNAFADSHIIEVTTVGIGDYEYSLDDGSWQDDPIFIEVSIGEHRVTVRDKNGCGSASDGVIVMDYPKFFTPNGDGYNDTWNISAISTQPNAKIYIFDRYGKLLKQLSPNGEGWNGTYSGEQLPVSDYWFSVEYKEPNTGDRKEFTSHFTLKR